MFTNDTIHYEIFRVEHPQRIKHADHMRLVKSVQHKRARGDKYLQAVSALTEETIPRVKVVPRLRRQQVAA